jgi:hypothetical protein
MLDRIQAIHDACDLDLLLFFHRHPCALLSGAQLVAFLGYDRKRIAKSLDALIAAGHLTQSRNPPHSACLYVLTTRGDSRESLSSFLEFSATREGRLGVMRLRQSRPDDAPGARRRAPRPESAVA